MAFKCISRIQFPILELSRVHSRSKDLPEFKKVGTLSTVFAGSEIIKEQISLIVNMPVGKTYYFDMIATDGATIEHESKERWILSAGSGCFQISFVMSSQDLKDYLGHCLVKDYIELFPEQHFLK